MNEIWKDILNYEGLYQVSNLGRVRSNYKKGRILKQFYDKYGYKRVALCKNGKRKDYFVHRLVATMFLNNLDNKPQVNHIDGNKENNNISNLEWCTCQENVIHAIEKLNRRNKSVGQYDLNNNLLETYKSIIKASRKTNIKAQHIWRCCKNIKPTAGGFIWKYN